MPSKPPEGYIKHMTHMPAMAGWLLNITGCCLLPAASLPSALLLAVSLRCAKQDALDASAM